ncbi:hypothetical protein BpHYR1_025908 [Brachionus plicatilis]|uniref:Uncharacterized protein n=1 Tax=Brachionus plicatilis TaxID=10195 RepID=A0A3M7QVS1_BRAPC|nr:hypothetical protein BpHYR1_025908 [Brachionus plicatilis]
MSHNLFNHEDLEDLLTLIEEINFETGELNKNYTSLRSIYQEISQLSKKQSKQINNLIVENKSLREAVNSNHLVIVSLKVLIKNFINSQMNQKSVVPNIMHRKSGAKKIDVSMNPTVPTPVQAYPNNNGNKHGSLKSFNSYEPDNSNREIEDDNTIHKVAGSERKTNKKFSTKTYMKNAGHAEEKFKCILVGSIMKKTTKFRSNQDGTKSFKFSINSWPKGTLVKKYCKPYAERQSNVEMTEQNESSNSTNTNTAN